jgi:hypothetical protein
VLDGALLELLDAAGALGEPLDDGALEEPLAALPLGVDGDEPEALELDAPPEAGALGDELDELGELLSLLSTDTEPEAEPEGAVAGLDGEVVDPAAEDAEPAGGVVRETVRSPSLSQPVSNTAPSARDTATARFVSFM